jgi:hypothetical protein
MKIVLAQKHAVKGVMYGPGEVEVSEAVHATLERRGALSDPLAAFPPLIAAGYTTLDDARAQSDDKLLAIDGVGPAMIKKLRTTKE